MSDKMSSVIVGQRLKFCHEMATGVCRYQSAINAGDSVKSAHVTASRLLKNDKVVSMIQQIKRENASRTYITAERILQGFASIAFNDSPDIRDNDKLKALEHLGKHLGMFTQKTEVELTDGRSNADFKAMFESMTTDDKLKWLKEREKDDQIIEG